MSSATRFTTELARALSRLDDGTRSIAEINRMLGIVAEGLGVQRPSYERVRTLVHEQRGYTRLGPSRAQVLFEISSGARSFRELADWHPTRDLPEDAGLHPDRYRRSSK